MYVLRREQGAELDMGTLQTASVGFIWLFEDPVEPAHLAYQGYDVDFDGRLALAVGVQAPFSDQMEQLLQDAPWPLYH